MPLHFHSDLTLMPLRCKIDFNSMSRLAPCDVILTSLRCLFDLTSISLRCHFGSTSISLRSHFDFTTGNEKGPASQGKRESLATERETDKPPTTFEIGSHLSSRARTCTSEQNDFPIGHPRQPPMLALCTYPCLRYAPTYA
jgi:hypothetical protein